MSKAQQVEILIKFGGMEGINKDFIQTRTKSLSRYLKKFYDGNWSMNKINMKSKSFFYYLIYSMMFSEHAN